MSLLLTSGLESREAKWKRAFTQAGSRNENVFWLDTIATKRKLGWFYTEEYNCPFERHYFSPSGCLNIYLSWLPCDLFHTGRKHFSPHQFNRCGWTWKHASHSNSVLLSNNVFWWKRPLQFWRNRGAASVRALVGGREGGLVGSSLRRKRQKGKGIRRKKKREWGLWQWNIEPGEVILCPAVSVKRRVCGVCSVSRAHRISLIVFAFHFSFHAFL